MEKGRGGERRENALCIKFSKNFYGLDDIKYLLIYKRQYKYV